MNKKWTLILSVCVLSVLLIAGCSPKNTAKPSPTPNTSPITSPLNTSNPSPSTKLPSTSPDASPSTDPQASPGTTADSEELAKLSDDIAKEVEKLSEVKSASVVVNESTVLIGVEFDDAYKGEINDRITQMIEEKAKEVDESLNEIMVTDDKALKDEIEDMRSKVKSGDLIEDLKADFDGLINRIKPKA